MLACGLPFHVGEIAFVLGGGLIGAGIIAKLCWGYIKSKFSKTSCDCDCCEHDAPKDEV
jgi:hypothetical protein